MVHGACQAVKAGNDIRAMAALLHRSENHVSGESSAKCNAAISLALSVGLVAWWDRCLEHEWKGSATKPGSLRGPLW